MGEIPRLPGARPMEKETAWGFGDRWVFPEEGKLPNIRVGRKGGRNQTERRFRKGEQLKGGRRIGAGKMNPRRKVLVCLNFYATND